MAYILKCLVGASEHSLLFNSYGELESYAASLMLKPVGSYPAGEDVVCQYFEPDFEEMSRADRERYSAGLHLNTEEEGR